MDAETILGQAKNIAFDKTVFRNICSLIKTQDLFDDIAEPEDYSLAQTIEEYAKPPYFESHQPIINRPFEEALWNESVQYPFENWQESRYSTGKFGVWYGASDLTTGVYETAYHWIKRMLTEEREVPNGRIIERKVYTVDLKAVIFDLRPSCKKYPLLIAKDDYSLTQSIGSILHIQGHPGLISESARHTGQIQAIFNSKVLSNPRTACWFRYTIDNDRVLITEGSADVPGDIRIADLVSI